ncbi:MAG: hypothetical protein LBH68_05140 [Bifidobacteriaceae bacterium]|nr:hypothetical protein [Bifidobacteriaceae bacterium]
MLLTLEIALLASGRLAPRAGLAAIIATEATAVGMIALIMIPAVREIVRLTRSGERLTEATRKSLAGRMPKPLVRLATSELGIWAALIRVLRRSPAVPAESTRLAYATDLKPVVAVCFVLGLVEIAVTAFVVPWIMLRIVLLVAGAYALVWVAGFLAAATVYPHYVAPGVLILRFAHLHQVTVPLSAIGTVRIGLKAAPSRQTLSVENQILTLAVMGSTNVQVDLAAPGIEVAGAPVSTIRFACDDPATAAAALSAVAERGDPKSRSGDLGASK